jgi:hypothetical protein
VTIFVSTRFCQLTNADCKDHSVLSARPLADLGDPANTNESLEPAHRLQCRPCDLLFGKVALALPIARLMASAMGLGGLTWSASAAGIVQQCLPPVGRAPCWVTFAAWSRHGTHGHSPALDAGPMNRILTTCRSSAAGPISRSSSAPAALSRATPAQHIDCIDGTREGGSAHRCPATYAGPFLA